MIKGSPFECHAFNPEDVYILDVPAQDSHPPGKVIQFKVDRRRAGLADLEVVVTSPVGEALPVEIKALNDEQGVDLVEFRPEVTGLYKFVVHYGGDQVPDSPVSFMVREPVGGSRFEGGNVDVRAFGQGLQKGQINAPASFEIERPNTDELPEIEIIHRETGQRLRCSITRTAPNAMKVTYLPEEPGVFLVRLLDNQGQVMEYPVNICDPSAVRIIGGCDPKTGDFSPRLSPGEEAIVSLYVGEAGPGKVEAELTHPTQGKTKVDVATNRDR